MRVLFLSNERAGPPSTAYEHRLEGLMHSLADQGLDTQLVSLRDHGPGRPVLAHPLSFPFIRRRLAEADVIHAGGLAGYTAGVLRRCTPALIVQDIHGDSVSESRLQWTEQRDAFTGYVLAQAVIAEAITYRFGDCFTVVSEPQRRKLIDGRGIASDRIAIVRNGVDPDLFEPRPTSSSGRFTVAYAGGFQLWQGIENLVRAAELLADQPIQLKIIGFRGADEETKNMIAARLGPRVTLVDRTDRRELVAHLASADVLIIPRPRHEAVHVAFPTKFGEYLALGKPVIVCDVDETALLVRQHECGFVAQPDPRTIADTIALSAQWPREALARMGQNSRQLAQREFSWSEIGRRYAEVLTAWRAPSLEARGVAP
jgi:glycosyltransferase involved in cell wall biosynthesis